MAEWAGATPPLAVSDYTHFNYAGAKKIAGLIYENIDREYVEFKKQNNLAVANAVESGGNGENSENVENSGNGGNGGNGENESE